MMRTRWFPTFLAAILALAASSPAFAQAAAVGRAAVKETLEAIGRRATSEGAESVTRELIQFGGEAAVRETVERVAREAGEQTAMRAARLVDAHGVVALRAIRSAPSGGAAPLIAAIDQTAPDLVAPALRALARDGEGEALATLGARFGPSALETAARHPGVGTRLVGSLGEDGVLIAARATTDEAISFARHADDLAALAPDTRAGVMRALAAAPGKAAAFLDKHPKFFLIAGAGALFVANADSLLDGTAQVVLGPDGKATLVERAGLLERAVVRPALSWILPVLASLLAAWGIMKLAFAARRERAVTRRVERAA